MPNINYLKFIIQSEQVLIEQKEHFIKQTFRNRCIINTANGPLILTIPTIQTHTKQIIQHTQISYAENWQQKHWRAIEFAYRNTPYFQYFEYELKACIEYKTECLLEYNLQLLNKVLSILRIKKNLLFTNEFQNTNFNLLPHSYTCLEDLFFKGLDILIFDDK